MRDTNINMIQIIDALNENGVCGAVIIKIISGEPIKCKFSVSQDDYYNLRKILEFRPFDNTGFGAYRYFFALSYRKEIIDSNPMAYMTVRVEQLKEHKQYEFLSSRELIANLLWFDDVKEKELLRELIVP